MDIKFHETINLCVEIINSKQQFIKGDTWSHGTNLCLPFDVNVKLNLSINTIIFGTYLAEKQKH